MGSPVDFAGSNKVLGPPEGWDDDQCGRMPVHTNGRATTSCWELTEEELREVVRTRRVWVQVIFQHGTQPPIFVGTEDRCRELALDFGPVWRKE